MPNQSARIELPIHNPKSAIRNRSLVRPSGVQIERELEVFSQLMDNKFRIPVLNWHFGLNALIDLVPGIGDVATTLVALYVVVSAVRYRVPKITLLRMGLNIAIYFVVGLIPIFGDIFAVWWKPNIRNINLLRKRATVQAGEAKRGRTSDWLFVGLIVVGVLGLLFTSLVFGFFFIWWLLSNFSVPV
ncbi:MAG: DUF4112 domain-containing protein [Pyrinomonadaceae bacterium]